MAAKKAASADSAAPAEEKEAAKAAEEAPLPSLDTFTEEDQAKVTKIQAAARGKIARKEVAAKKAASADSAALEAAPEATES